MLISSLSIGLDSQNVTVFTTATIQLLLWRDRKIAEKLDVESQSPSLEGDSGQSSRTDGQPGLV